MSGQMQPILLVEDDRVDVMTVKRALREIQVANEVIVAANGEEALAYLRNPGNARPGFILLDINMPRMNGIEFLRIAKDDPSLRIIPVIILTTSKDEKDRFDSFNLSVAGYMIKPVDYPQFVEVMRAIRDYWNLSEQPN